MIQIEKTDVYGFEAAIRGMRNPMNSWDKSDSEYKSKCLVFPDVEYCLPDCHYDQCMCTDPEFIIGANDHDLMMRLASAGSVHAKYRRMITVTCDITAPLYWWKEFDTYKVGTVANSCSTMHKIHERPFILDDFSREHIDGCTVCVEIGVRSDERLSSWDVLYYTIQALNYHREKFIETKDKRHWWQMIQLLPSSYNQKRTVQLNYEVLVGMYRDRRNHKLDEWHTFCDWIRELPYSEIITGLDWLK